MLTYLKNKIRPLLSDKTLNNYHYMVSLLACTLYRFPSRGMKVIGITGTNGKTTTAHFVSQIFSRAGLKVAMATTIDFQIGAKQWKNNEKQTTISGFQLQKFLRMARSQGANVAVIEVTSHALVQHRLWGMVFDTVVLTNITHDHLDYHKTFAKYVEAKQILFANKPRIAVVNADDPSALQFLSQPASQQYVYSLKQIPELIEKTQAMPVVARKIVPGTRETMFTAVTPAGQVVIDLKLPGRFNISNALASIAVALGSNIPLYQIKAGIEDVTLVRGRMERIDMGQPFTVILDYAHTPDAFEKIFESIMSVARRNIIAIHGATGARDTTKRPILGSISGRFADTVIITNEDPYHEDPMTIINEVVAGVKRGALKSKPKILNENLFLIEDRREAIAKGLKLAQPGDIVLVLGKGAEEVMAVGDKNANHGFKLVPWNEREIVKQELKKLIGS